MSPSLKTLWNVYLCLLGAVGLATEIGNSDFGGGSAQKMATSRVAAGRALFQSTPRLMPIPLSSNGYHILDLHAI
jgi:hypothetical protein